MAPSLEVETPVVAPSKDTNGAAAAVDDRVKQNELKELAIADEMGGTDMYISASEDTEWYHWVGSISRIREFKVRFENRSGAYIIALKTEPHAELGKHRHRGEVRAYTIKGPWGYHEYEWKGEAGDYVTEVPGTIHTLYMGAGSEVHFTATGSIEFFNDDNTLRETMDGVSFWRMYVEHCEKLGKKPNKKLWY